MTAMARLLWLLGVVSGALVLLAPPGPARAAEPPAIPWQWSAQPDLYPRVDLTARDRHAGFSLHENQTPGKQGSTAVLTHSLQKGGVRMTQWQVTLAEPGAGDLAGAAMVIAGQQVFVARYNRIATGCTLYAFTVDRGELQWKVELKGVGPISHSKWYNRVQLALIGNQPVAFGNEGPTHAYIEQRDAATGALLQHQSLQGIQPPRPLAEPLYYELQNMLQRQPAYRVSTQDFVRRHVMNPQSTLPEFATAVDQLDGQPVLFGRYFIEVHLRTLPSGEQVVEARRR